MVVEDRSIRGGIRLEDHRGGGTVRGNAKGCGAHGSATANLGDTVGSAHHRIKTAGQTLFLTIVMGVILALSYPPAAAIVIALGVLSTCALAITGRHKR